MCLFQYDPTVNLGDVLTILAILGSVFVAIRTWNKELDLHKAQRAQSIRTAAAKILVKIDQWNSLSLSLFERVKPNFVDTKEFLKKQFKGIFEKAIRYCGSPRPPLACFT